MPAKILVHATDREVGALFTSLLQQYRHEVWCATSVDVSSQLARKAGPLDLVLCLDDRGAASELRADLREIAPDTRFLQLPSLRSAGLVGASDGGLDSPGVMLEAAELMEMVDSALELVEQGHRHAAVTVESLRLALSETILTFSMLLEQFDYVNGGNSRMIQEYSIKVAHELGLSAMHADEIGFAALLQDIGLIKNRGRGRGRHHDEDAQQVREHPIRSANMVQRMKLPWKLRHIVLAHHEWYNGRGYPHGLKGRDIPLGARILAVTNAFFAMISKRPNRAALPKAEAVEELRRAACRQFDPEVVEIFLSLMKDKAFHDVSGTRRVAIASADDTFAQLVRARFEAAASAAAVTESGLATMAFLRAQPADAILLDAELKDMSGFQLLHWIKSDPELAALPLIVLSGDPDASTHAFMAHDMGADDFLAKPVRAAELVARVNAILRRRDRLARAEFSQMHDGEGLRGNLDELSVPDLVSMLRDGRKTATVTLFLAGGTATLAFDGGQLVHARTPEASGEEAVRAIFRAISGDFRIEHGAATAERSIERRMDLLVSEALDERNRLLAAEKLASLPAEAAAAAAGNFTPAFGTGPDASSAGTEHAGTAPEEIPASAKASATAAGGDDDADASETITIEVTEAEEEGDSEQSEERDWADEPGGTESASGSQPLLGFETRELGAALPAEGQETADARRPLSPGTVTEVALPRR